MSKTVAVFGATGTAGGGVMRKLVEAGHSVLALTRDVAGDKARAAAELGAKPVAVDLDDRAAIRAAIEGADAAIEVGTPHFIFQSALVGDARGVLSVGSKRAIEERIAELELRATILRPGWFMENLLNYFPVAEQDGKLIVAMALPVDKDNGLIAIDDIGRAAVAIVADGDSFVGREIDLVSDTGSPASMARIIGEEVGRETIAVEVPMALLQRLAAVRGRLSLCADQAAAAKWWLSMPMASVSAEGPMPKALSTRRTSPLMPGCRHQGRACPLRRARMTSNPLIVA